MIQIVRLGEGEIRRTHGVEIHDVPCALSTMNVAVVGLKVRYPEWGLVSNVVSDMVVRVLEGRVFVRGGNCSGGMPVQQGDHVVIPRRTAYAWEPADASGVVLHIVSSPPWVPDQQVQVWTEI